MPLRDLPSIGSAERFFASAAAAGLTQGTQLGGLSEGRFFSISLIFEKAGAGRLGVEKARRRHAPYVPYAA